VGTIVLLVLAVVTNWVPLYILLALDIGVLACGLAGDNLVARGDDYRDDAEQRWRVD
jgi:hypothetical protein